MFGNSSINNKKFASQSFFFPVYIPKEEIEYKQKVIEKTKKAKSAYDRWWNVRLCACGCERKCISEYIHGHRNPITAIFAKEKTRKLKEMLFTSEALRIARIEDGRFSHYKIAPQLGIIRRIYGRFEDGTRIPPMDLQIKIVNLLPNIKLKNPIPQIW